MKRGFLNSKKVKGQPLYDDSPGRTSVPPPPRMSFLSAGPKKPSERVVGLKIMERTPNSRIAEPFDVVRVPSPSLTKSKEPSSVCIFRQTTRNTIANTPGFYTPPKPLKSADVVLIKDTPSMGLGLFARHNVKIHQMVCSERPLVIFPRGIPFFGHSKEEAIKNQELLFEKEIQRALKIMPKEDVDAYMSLSNCAPDCPPLYGIARTNAFDTDIEDGNPELRGCEYAAVGRLASRINHNCTPNVYVDFDIPTFSLRVTALRDIKAGEQFFNCYCHPFASVKERQRQLTPYRFVCECKACINATPETDKLREEMDGKLDKIINEKEEMFADPRFCIRSIRPLLKLEKEIIKEGLDFGEKFIELLFIIYQAYRELNDPAKGLEYLNKVKKYEQ